MGTSKQLAFNSRCHKDTSLLWVNFFVRDYSNRTAWVALIICWLANVQWEIYFVYISGPENFQQYHKQIGLQQMWKRMENQSKDL